MADLPSSSGANNDETTERDLPPAETRRAEHISIASYDTTPARTDVHQADQTANNTTTASGIASSHVDELLRNILDRLVRQETQTNSRFEAIEAARTNPHHNLDQARCARTTTAPQEHPGSSLLREPTRSLGRSVDCFNETASKTALSDETAIEALKRTLKDALRHATRFAKAKEEREAYAEKFTPTRTPPPKEKKREGHYEPRQRRDQSYAREKKAKSATTYRVRSSNPPTTNSERKQPWDQRTRSFDTAKEPSSYCDFHGKCTHTTAECRHIRGTIEKVKFEASEGSKSVRSDRRAEAIARQFLAKQETCKGRRNSDDRKRSREAHARETATRSPRQRVDTIMGNLTPNHNSVHSVRDDRHQTEMHEEWVRKTAPMLNTADPVTFTEGDASDLIHPHNDPLVVELLILESLVTKVLIDTGSSVNVIFKGVLAEMGLEHSAIKTDTRLLTGFDGNSIMTIGTATFPIYVGGTMTWFDFVIVDKPITYNVILGTPWIHRMKAVTSTYHQCVKFPTPRGIFTLRGHPTMARRCLSIEQRLRYAEPRLDQMVAKSIARSNDQTFLELR